jgi:hypothetical protein
MAATLVYGIIKGKGVLSKPWRTMVGEVQHNGTIDHGSEW